MVFLNFFTLSFNRKQFLTYVLILSGLICFILIAFVSCSNKPFAEEKEDLTDNRVTPNNTETPLSMTQPIPTLKITNNQNTQSDMFIDTSIITKKNIKKLDISKEIKTENNDATINSIAYLPKVNLLITGLSDGQLRSYDINTGAYLIKFKVFDNQIRSIIASPDGSTIAVTDWKSVKIISTMTWETITDFSPSNFGEIVTLNFSMDSKYLGIGSNGGKKAVWESNTNTIFTAFEEELPDFYISSLEFSPNNEFLISAGYDTKIWLLKTGELVENLQTDGIVTTLSLSPKGDLLAIGTDNYETIIWDIDFDPLSLNQVYKEKKSDSTIIKLRFSNNGKWLVSSEENNKINLWNIKDNYHLINLIAHKHIIGNFIFSDENDYFISWSYDGVINFWDTLNGNKLHSISLPNGFIRNVIVSDDWHNLIILSKDGSIFLLSVL